MDGDKKERQMNKRKLGASYEDIACHYLEGQGLRILERNYRICQGEVDIIAWEENVLVFIEVKYRKNRLYGEPAEAVSFLKQKKISKVARQYCYVRRMDKQVRFDVISICAEEITWYKDAFPYRGDD